MGAFEDVHHRRITGSLAMFDRMIFKGHLMRLYGPGGVQAFLGAQGVPLTRFAAWAKTTTDALCLHAKRSAEEAGRPYMYLEHAKTQDTGQTKEDFARGIAERDGVTEGLVCILRTAEPCGPFKLRPNHATHRLDVVSVMRKCVHHDWYFIDPEFGFMHIRLQSWLPFTIQVYVNGREWLARQLDTRGIAHLRADNAFCCASRTSRPPVSCASASPTGPGRACSMHWPDG